MKDFFRKHKKKMLIFFLLLFPLFLLYFYIKNTFFKKETQPVQIPDIITSNNLTSGTTLNNTHTNVNTPTAFLMTDSYVSTLVKMLGRNLGHGGFSSEFTEPIATVNIVEEYYGVHFDVNHSALSIGLLEAYEREYGTPLYNDLLMKVGIENMDTINQFFN